MDDGDRETDEVKTFLALASNPLLRKVGPVLGEIANVFFDGVNAEDKAVDDVIAKIRTVLPSIARMRSVQVGSATTADLSEILAGFGVVLRPEDVSYWLDEFRSFSVNADETIKDFVTGPSGKQLFVNLVKRSTTGKQALNTPDPVYDPETGVYTFD